MHARISEAVRPPPTRTNRTAGPHRSPGPAIATALLLAALLPAAPAVAQQKTGPGVPTDDSLTWQGITLYGVIDLGLQYDSHSAPFTPYRPAASGNIIRSNAYQSVFGLTPSNMGQTRVGLHGIEPVVEDWSAIFQVETFFNPQSGQIADSLRSLAANNGKPVTQQSVGVDGSSAGQVFQTAYVGIGSPRFGSLTYGRQLGLLSEGTIRYDPNFNATAFGLLGASNAYSGGGSSEDNRLDSALRYSVGFGDRVHIAGLYRFNGSSGSGRTAVQANLGGDFAGIDLDAYYSRVNSSIAASSLSAAQVAALPPGYSPYIALAATISDNSAYALMGRYRLDPLQLFSGYEYIRYGNPRTPLSAGSADIGGYVLAFPGNTAYDHPRLVQVYWAGVRYAVNAHLELTAAYYGVRQGAYGSGSQAGCSTTAYGTCSGGLEAFSLDADYRFNVHFDTYVGAMYSGVHDGLASGYLYTSNINPTIGVRYKF
jgi:predicted porin